MKACTFCGCETDNKNTTCASCGSTDFLYICPNCSNKFEGKYCPDCGTAYNAVAKICPNCSDKYFSKACPNCGYNSADEEAASNQRNTFPYSRTNVIKKSDAHTNAGVAILFSVIGMMSCMFPFSIVGLVLAARSKKSGEKSSLINAAFIIGIIGIVISAIGFIFYVIAIASSNIK
ncbi:MAG: hypothetical protein IJ757_08650 [Clostridiales bacterium]|nr:hypothetical protein [Clostridiales bacterium]